VLRYEETKSLLNPTVLKVHCYWKAVGIMGKLGLRWEKIENLTRKERLDNPNESNRCR
jgi:hypothetical protein